MTSPQNCRLPISPLPIETPENRPSDSSTDSSFRPTAVRAPTNWRLTISSLPIKAVECELSDRFDQLVIPAKRSASPESRLRWPRLRPVLSPDLEEQRCS